jgi:hypothetical protein
MFKKTILFRDDVSPAVSRILTGNLDEFDIAIAHS